MRASVPVVAGVLWAAVVLSAVALGAAVVALVTALVAVVASASAVRLIRPRRRGRPFGSRYLIPLAAVTGGLAPVSALGGPVPLVVVLVVGGVAALWLAPAGRPPRKPAPSRFSVRLPWRVRLVLATTGPGLGGASLVLARHQGLSEALALLAAVLGYDAAAFLMGNARTAVGGVGGLIAGAWAVGVVALFVAAMMNPPFFGTRPWIVFGLTAAAAPIGVKLADTVTAGTRLPALRRLDSLIVAGPVWVASLAVLVHR